MLGDGFRQYLEGSRTLGVHAQFFLQTQVFHAALLVGHGGRNDLGQTQLPNQTGFNLYLLDIILQHDFMTSFDFPMAVDPCFFKKLDGGLGNHGIQGIRGRPKIG